jgi:LPXTG-motif cell wall-anchored protein
MPFSTSAKSSASKKDGSALEAGPVAGIAIGVVVLALLLIGGVLFLVKKNKKDQPAANNPAQLSVGIV